MVNVCVHVLSSKAQCNALPCFIISFAIMWSAAYFASSPRQLCVMTQFASYPGRPCMVLQHICVHLLITTHVAMLYMCYLPYSADDYTLCLHYPLDGLYDAPMSSHHLEKHTSAMLKLCYLYGQLHTQCTVSASTFRLPCVSLHHMNKSYWWWSGSCYAMSVSSPQFLNCILVILSVIHDTMLGLGHPDEHVWCCTLSTSSFWSHLILNYVCAMSLMIPSCLMPSYVYILSVITTGDSEPVTRCECLSCYSMTVS